MPENTLVSPFLGSFMTAIFIFSTIWTLVFFYYQGVNQQLNTQGLSDNPNNPTATKVSSSGIFGFIIDVADGVLEFVSWITPFALVKLLILEVMKGTPEIYQVINYLILRPVGWITSIFTINYVLSKIPTMSGEV